MIRKNVVFISPNRDGFDADQVGLPYIFSSEWVEGIKTNKESQGEQI